MKKIHFILTAFFGLTVMFSSCEKNAVQELPSIAIEAQVKLFNFAPNSPSVNFFSDTTKISAIVSTTGIVVATGTAYGSSFPASNYITIAAGSSTLTAKIPSTATADANLAVSNLLATVESDKYYSFYTSGIYNTTTKTAEAFIIEDIIPVRDTSSAYIRFVNAISNAAPLNFVAKSTTAGSVEVSLATGIAYKAGSEFIKVPQTTIDVYLRNASSTTNLVTRTAISLIKGRAYTITARGDITSTGTTKPALDFTSNR